MLIMPQPCKHCGSQVVWLTLTSGHVRCFWARSWPADQIAPGDQYAIRRIDKRPVAVPLDGDLAPQGMCLLRHACAERKDAELMGDLATPGLRQVNEATSPS